MRIILAALLVISFTQGFSENKQTIFGGVQLNLPKPDNLCEIKDTGPTAEIFEITDALQITAQNKLLAYFEDCKHLESLLDASKTKSLDYSPEYILITAYNPNHNEETLYTNYTTKRFNEEMASSVSDEDINEIFMKVERGANQTLKNYDIDLEVVYDEPIDLGVLDIGDAVIMA